MRGKKEGVLVYCGLRRGLERRGDLEVDLLTRCRQGGGAVCYLSDRERR